LANLGEGATAEVQIQRTTRSARAAVAAISSALRWSVPRAQPAASAGDLPEATCRAVSRVSRRASGGPKYQAARMAARAGGPAPGPARGQLASVLASATSWGTGTAL